ncbi:DNA-processing protein DprA [Microbacterium sp. RU33B]|uniref:DNA-processing protein DprA n=1 Tax=Microbacterium sp. RU33B TaxID=1907390 RepID=UPI0009617F83|nr:DNA-processing protein DprA [Microbacterium sp. RU33B]SIT73282.1 DNA protecting protein DprA [Microbacterium sp. RU33B]
MSGFDLSPRAARRALSAVSDTVDVADAVVAERYARVVWNSLAEPGDGVAGRVIAELGATAALRLLMDGDLTSTSVTSERELTDGRKRWMPRLSAAPIAHALEIASVRRVRLLVPGDVEWPAQVDDLGENAPLALWARGDASLPARAGASVAIVGARAATSYGEHVAMELSADLAASGVPIVSGAAYGIDGAAHRAALAVGGATIALLAGGVDRPYPAGHSSLIDRIATAGAVVSEVPCGASPTKWRFLARNRLIAAVSAATVVVEAGWRSGSLNTAGHAAALGRSIGAVPGPVTSGASAGCHRLLREFGAQCITSAADVRELLGFVEHPAAPPPDGRPPTDERMRVRDALSGRSWRDVDDLAARSGMSPSDVEMHLGLLLIEGRVEREGRRWRHLAER